MRDVASTDGLARVRVTGCCLIAPTPQQGEPIARITLSPDELLAPERGRRLDPFSQFSLIAVEYARQQARLVPNDRKCKLATEGVALGSALGAVATTVRYAKRLVEAGPTATNPIDFPDSIDGAAAGHVALDLGLGGPSVTFTDGESSAVSALVYAARQIAWRRATRMHVVAGDKFDRLLGAAFSNDSSLEAIRPAECVLALILEAFDESQGRDSIELDGFWASNDDVTDAGVVAAPSEPDTGQLCWAVGRSDEVGCVRYLTSEFTRLEDPSGALRFAGALAFVKGAPMCVLGNPSIQLPMPVAGAVRCGDSRYPDLRLVGISD